MAKAKKTESGAGKKKAAKSAPPKPAGTPLIDTDLAARNAAQIIGNRAKLGLAVQPPADNSAAAPESASFKQFKQNATSPGAKGIADLLPHPEGARKPTMPFTGRDQRGHAQTQSGFNKTGVPRRTNG